ncbi:MAG: ribosome recycling factor [Bacteroidota bacterium]|nr:ribosome recycling factor [Bacteroidota bacterium]
MTEEVELILDDAKENMEKAIIHLDKELASIRAGKANVRILDGIMVDYYGNLTPLNQISNLGTPDGKTISIQPWEKKMIAPIEKAIMKANIGLTPVNNGELVRINIPALTEERRKDLVKQVHNEEENAKVSVRSIRKDSKDEIKKLGDDGLSEDEVKTAEEDIQKLTDSFGDKIEKLIAAKEKDIMTI